jgi:hypothetical protein
MKITNPVLNRKFLGMALVFGLLSRAAFASDPTALSLVKEANEYVGKDARDKVVQIRSDKSVGTLTPVIWYVVFYDPDASFKATEVKFAAGKKVGTSRPFRVMEFVKADKVFDLTKIKVDSDKAIKTATAEPLLKNLTVKATQLWLDSNYKTDLTVTGPIWKVRLWAAKLRNPNDNADIGEVWISADEGNVIKTDLHIDRVD